MICPSGSQNINLANTKQIDSTIFYIVSIPKYSDNLHTVIRDFSGEQIGVNKGLAGNAKKGRKTWSVGTALDVGQVCTIESITISAALGGTG